MGTRPLFEISNSVGTANSGEPMNITRIRQQHPMLDCQSIIMAQILSRREKILVMVHHCRLFVRRRMPYGKRSSRQRPNDAASSSRVPSVEREQPGPCRPLRPEREDGAQMAQTDHKGRRTHGPEEAEEHSADAGRGGHRGGVPAEDPAAGG